MAIPHLFESISNRAYPITFLHFWQNIDFKKPDQFLFLQQWKSWLIRSWQSQGTYPHVVGSWWHCFCIDKYFCNTYIMIDVPDTLCLKDKFYLSSSLVELMFCSLKRCYLHISTKSKEPWWCYKYMHIIIKELPDSIY